MNNSAPLYYSVIQVVPDPVRDERINVGVVVWDNSATRGVMKFSRSRQRLHALGVEDTSFVADFQAWLAAALPASQASTQLQIGAGPDPDERWSLDAMQMAASEWGGMIRLTEPRPSRGHDVNALAQDVYDRTVFVHKASVDPDSGRQAIRRSAAALVRTAMTERFGAKPPLEIAVSFDLQGQVSTHQFDVVMTNGTARGALVTPNFLDKRTEQVRRDLDAAAWAIEDVRGQLPDVEFAILRGSTARPALASRLDAITRALDVRPLERAELRSWATDQVAANA